MKLLYYFYIILYFFITSRTFVDHGSDTILQCSQYCKIKVISIKINMNKRPNIYIYKL